MRKLWLVGICLLVGTVGITRIRAQASVVISLTDYVTMPMTGSPTGTGNLGSLARINVLREEPGGRGRFFVNDLNGPLYILDKTSKALTTYLDFNGRDGKPGLFEKLPTAAGYANGLIGFQFDPDYARSGVFYTIHLEEVTAPGSAMPRSGSVPGLNLVGYATTTPIRTPGTIERHAVVIEWTDTNLGNTTFEGTARELMRVELNTRIHPMGDMIFNPTARPGDADWRVMYIGCGDGGSGEQSDIRRMNPQRLDTMVGKILRIIPDLALRTSSSTVSENGRYRVPNDNPFAHVSGARGEIWAYGLRNPHRLTWDVADATPSGNHLLTSSIGLHTWETVYVVRKGANYGYSEREGNERLQADNTTTKIPTPDVIPVRVSDTVTNGSLTPRYPALQYPHTATGGDGIVGGFVYRGRLLQALRGKFVFGDISTGKIWYADFQEMLSADDENPATVAGIYEVGVEWAAPGSTARTYPTMFPVVLSAYKARGGTDPDLPGSGEISGPGRADIRLAVDADGELYILSKVDGMIRRVVGATRR